MDIPQIVDPALGDVNQLGESYKAPIALIGCGPASVSCATFLARMGYTRLTVFEKKEFFGGLRSLRLLQMSVFY
jgi:dihydropyrimidine dehydrogenase (NADP+)